MALKNLFDMVKADRYTSDGREALIKAQEAETEDKVYQIGEISQKTGLQKTANGWVKPKKGAAPAKKENPTRTFEFKSGPDGMPVAGSGKEVKTYKTKKEAQEALKKQNAAESKPVDKEKLLDTLSFDLVDTTADIEEEYNAVEHSDNSRLPEFVRQEIERDYVNKTNGEKWTDEEKDIIAEEVTRRIKERQSSKPAAPRRESVSAGRMQKDLDGNFWSRPEDFKEDITSRGWDVDEMTNEYAVISNEAGSQYEVRFDDHSDDGDLTVRNFKALQIDEDDDDDSLEDKAPRVLTGDCKIRIKRETKDGTYTPESINAPREKLEKKLTGDCKVRVRKA